MDFLGFELGSDCVGGVGDSSGQFWGFVFVVHFLCMLGVCENACRFGIDIILEF